MKERVNEGAGIVNKIANRNNIIFPKIPQFLSIDQISMSIIVCRRKEFTEMSFDTIIWSYGLHG